MRFSHCALFPNLGPFRLLPLQILNGNDYVGPLEGIEITKFIGQYTPSQWKLEVKIPNSGKGQMMLLFLRFRTDAERRLVADAIGQYLESESSQSETDDARKACESFIEMLTPYGKKGPPFPPRALSYSCAVFGLVCRADAT